MYQHVYYIYWARIWKTQTENCVHFFFIPHFVSVFFYFSYFLYCKSFVQYKQKKIITVYIIYLYVYFFIVEYGIWVYLYMYKKKTIFFLVFNLENWPLPFIYSNYCQLFAMSRLIVTHFEVNRKDYFFLS